MYQLYLQRSISIDAILFNNQVIVHSMLSGKESACQCRRRRFSQDPLEKGMAILFSIFDWAMPWTKEPGGLQSVRSQRVGYNLVIKQQQQSIV